MIDAKPCQKLQPQKDAQCVCSSRKGETALDPCSGVPHLAIKVTVKRLRPLLRNVKMRCCRNYQRKGAVCKRCPIRALINTQLAQAN